MNTVDISCERIEVPDWIEALREFALEILNRLGIDGWEVSILLCDDHFMRELNLQYRGLNEPTDVLSFAIHADHGENGFSAPVSYGTITAGDIVLSLDTWQRQAKELNINPSEELKRLALHGILHLMGMNHESNDPGQEPMLQKQEEILKQVTGEIIF